MNEQEYGSANMSKVHKLPTGWQWVKLGEVCEFLDSKRVPVNEDERRRRILGKPISSLYPYYGANGQVGWIDDYIFDEPLILLAEDGGFFGSLTKSIAYKIVGKSWVNNHAHVLRPKDSIIIDFCHFALSIRPDIGQMVTGNTRPKLNQEIAAQIQIPLPPLSEQKRISVILNEQLAAVDKARAAAEAQLEAAKALPAAYLREVFPRPGQELPAGWKWVKLGDVCARIEYGYTTSADTSIKQPKFLRITDIQNGLVDWESVPGCQIPGSEEGEYSLQEDDIVFARTGATTGKSYILKNPPRSIFASYLIRVRTKQTVIKADFLYSFFLSDAYWQQIASGARGGAQAGFNATMLRDLVVPLPPILVQERIAANMFKRLGSVDNLTHLIYTLTDQFNSYPSAILRKAFNGEL